MPKTQIHPHAAAAVLSGTRGMARQLSMNPPAIPDRASDCLTTALGDAENHAKTDSGYLQHVGSLNTPTAPPAPANYRTRQSWDFTSQLAGFQSMLIDRSSRSKLPGHGFDYIEYPVMHPAFQETAAGRALTAAQAAAQAAVQAASVTAEHPLQAPGRGS